MAISMYDKNRKYLKKDDIIKYDHDYYWLDYNKTNNIQFKSKYKTGAGAGVNETFRQYDPDELEKLLKESQKGKF